MNPNAYAYKRMKKGIKAHDVVRYTKYFTDEDKQKIINARKEFNGK